MKLEDCDSRNLVKRKVSFYDAIEGLSGKDVTMGDMVDVLFDLFNDESTGGEEDDDDNSTCSMIRVSKQDKLQIRESQYTLILKVLGHSIGFV